jgi:ABC-type branched-subunit amino acid transport system substrate-binding protein
LVTSSNKTIGINPLFDEDILPKGTTLSIVVNNTGGVATTAATLASYQVQLNETIGIIGPDLSSEAILVAPIAATYGLPVIGFSATSPALSSRTLYPTFLRDVPASDVSAEAVIDLCYMLGMTKVCCEIFSLLIP